MTDHAFALAILIVMVLGIMGSACTVAVLAWRDGQAAVRRWRVKQEIRRMIRDHRL